MFLVVAFFFVLSCASKARWQPSCVSIKPWPVNGVHPDLLLLVQVLWFAHFITGVLSAKVPEQQRRSITGPFIKGSCLGCWGF